MTHEYTRREIDYDVWLTAKVSAWESANRAAAVVLRRDAQRGLKMHVPPSTPMGVSLLEREFRELVRMNQQWPDVRAWMRGEG